MNDILTRIYEGLFRIYNQSYDLIFQVLYDNGVFGVAFWLFFLPPFIIFWFYLGSRYPYSTVRHWVGYLILICGITFGGTYYLFYKAILESSVAALNEALIDTVTGYMLYAKSLPMKYALVNSLFALLLSLLFSCVKPLSKINTHIPF